MDSRCPDYNGAWVGAIVPALLGRAGAAPSWLPDVVAEARGVVLLVLDGLGWQALAEHPDRLTTLRSMTGRMITTVVPTTTAAALTSISTGAAPGEHGVAGYRIRVGGDVLNVLRWQVAGSRHTPDAAEVQPILPFLGQNVPVVTKAEFAGTGFSRAHLRGTRLCGWRTTAALLTWCRRLVADGEPFVYLYYDGVDKIAHAHGLHDDFYPDELASTDRLVADVLDSLPRDYALVVTADHGQVHVDPEDRRSLDVLAPMIGAYSGEARFRSLHARSGATKDLLVAARETFEDEAWVFERQELVDGGWLGPHVSPAVVGRLGDVVLAARDGHAFADPSMPQESQLLSMHGSMTATEVEVPLLAAAGRG